MTENVKINRGLKGIYFERSGVSHIDGAKGELSYRGYSIHDLATQSTFVEVCYLLIHSELPTETQLAEFDAALKAARELPDQIFDIIRATKDGHPMDVLRTAVSALAALEADSQNTGTEAFLANGLRLTSQVPMIIAAHENIRNGRDPIPADKTLSHAANWLWMLKGEKPSEDAAKLADVDFILHAEHGATASSFAARFRKCCISRGMSSRRSASLGRCTRITFRRWNRSSRKVPACTSFSRSWCVAAMMRTSTLMGVWPPTR